MADSGQSSAPAPVPGGQILIYRDGGARLQVRLDGRTVWLTQAQIAELYQTTPQNITLHLKTIYEEGEEDPLATCKEYLQVRTEGHRQVQRRLKHYNLDVVLAIGYPRGQPEKIRWRKSRISGRKWIPNSSVKLRSMASPRCPIFLIVRNLSCR